MTKLLHLVGLVCACVLSTQGGAATINPNLAKDDICGAYEIIHINGIHSLIEDARANLNQLEIIYGNGHNEHLIRYGLAYNQTDGFVFDLRQSFAQLVAAYPGVHYREWLRLVLAGIWPDSLPATAIAEVIGSLVPLVTGLNRPTPYDDPNLEQMIDEISQIHRGGRLTLVAHSQGAIYANFVFERLTTPAAAVFKIPASRLGIVAVAAPTEKIHGGSYVTSQRDAVINTVRLIAPKTLPKTVDLQRSPYDILGHSFIDVYLLQIPSRVAIVAQIAAKLNSLKSNLGGPFNVFLSVQGSSLWGACGPGPGTPMPCVTDIGTFITGGILAYGVAGNSLYQIKPGDVGEMLGLATSHASSCVAALVSQRLARVNAGGNRYETQRVPGCSGVQSDGEAGAWAIYSSDGMTIDVWRYYGSEAYGSGEARVSALPWCDRPAT